MKASYVVVPALLIGGGIGVYQLTRTIYAANSIAPDVVGVDFKPKRDIRGITNVQFWLKVELRNPVDREWTLETIDAAVSWGNSALASVVSYGKPMKIAGNGITPLVIPVKVNIPSLLKVVGMGIVDLVRSAGQGSMTDRLKQLLPQTVTVKGSVKVNGRLLDFTKNVPLEVKE